MKAAYLNGPGGPEAFVYGDLPDPKAGAGEVLIRVRATTVNHVDTVYRSGIRPYFKITPPHVLGLELAGDVVAAGEGVQGFKAGDRVVASPRTGAYAELAVAEARNVVKLPASVSYEDGAAMAGTGATAWRAVVRRAEIRPSEIVLVTAAAGGTGGMIAQVAKASGAFVIGTAGGQRKLDLVKSLGADAVIDHYKEDLIARIKEITEGYGIDAAIDATSSAPIWSAITESLRPGGRVVLYGNMASQEVSFLVRHVFPKGLKIIGLAGDPAEVAATRPADMIGLMRLAAQGKLRSLTDRVLPLAEVAEAHRLVEDHAVAGKVVLTP